MKNILFSFLVIFSIFVTPAVQAAVDIEINSPAISSIKNSMQTRHGNLASLYANGAVGLTKDGMVAVKDASVLPLKDRGNLNSLVAAENKDRDALYKEIAVANGHPEWEAEIRSTFAQRWIQKAQSGWWVQDASGWVKK